MAAKTTKIDELNILDFDTYFGEMNLSDEEKERRIALAEQFEVMFMMYFEQYENDPQGDYTDLLTDTYLFIILPYLDMTEASAYISGYVSEIVKEIERVTITNTDIYYTSHDRAVVLAENEAQTIANYSDYKDAVNEGYTNKTWEAVGDSATRATHAEVDGTTIGIFETFQVGDYEMNYPRDYSLGAGPEEICNCRCTCTYS